MARPDAAEPALRGRHQGPGRQPHVLRAARRLGRQGRAVSATRDRDPDEAERRPVRGRQVRHLEAAPGRRLARRQAVHGRRRDLHLRLRPRPGDGGGQHQRLQLPEGREGRPIHRPRIVRRRDAVLGRRVRGQLRLHHPQASVRRLHRRQVAGCAHQPRAGRHRLLQVQAVPPRRHGGRRHEPELLPPQPPVFRQLRDEGRRRRRLGRPRGAADRRIRLRLEPAGRGRGADPPRPRRQGRRAAHRRGGDRAHPVQLHRPLDRGGRRAVEREDQAPPR